MRRRLNRRGKTLLALIVAIIILMVPGVAYAKDAIGSRIEIQKIDGTAFVVNGKGSKVDARQGVKLSNGESLQTAAGSYVYLSLDDTKVVKLDELSQIKIEKSGKKLRMEVEEGSMFFEVKEKLAGDEAMKIDADTMSMSIRGTSGVIGLRRINGEVVSSAKLLDGRVDMTYSDVSGDEHEFTIWGGESSLHVEGKETVVRDLIDISEIEGFAAMELANNGDLSKKILEESGLNSNYAIDHSAEFLARDQSYNKDHYWDVFENGNEHAVKLGNTTTNTTAATTTETASASATTETASDWFKPPVSFGANVNFTMPTSVKNNEQSNHNPVDSNWTPSTNTNTQSSTNYTPSYNYPSVGANDIMPGTPSYGGGSTSQEQTQDVATQPQDNNNSENQKEDSEEDKKDETVYYAVTFKGYNSEGELTTLKTEKVESGKNATAPTVPARVGYSFTGWEPNTLNNITQDTTFNAVYKINTYTVKFVDFDGTTLKTQTVEHGSSATAPSSPKREGYTFEGWDPDTDMKVITKDITYTAVYKAIEKEESYVELYCDNKLVDKIAVDDEPVMGSVFADAISNTYKANPDRVFDVKTEGKNASTYMYSSLDEMLAMSKNYQLYPEQKVYISVYSERERDNYYITSYKDSIDDPVNKHINLYGTNQESAETDDGVRANYWRLVGKQKENQLGYTAYVNYGNSNAILNNIYDGDALYTICPVKNTEDYYTANFYAWTDKTHEYSLVATLYQNVNDGGIMVSPVIASDEAVDATFIGWSTGEDIVEYTGKLTGDTNFYARYKLPTYKVTFVGWDGVVLDEQEVAKNSSAIPPETVESIEDGGDLYYFAKWNGQYTDVTQDTIVYAVFEKTPRYHVAFNGYDGTSIAIGNMLEGVMPEYFTPDNYSDYTFLYWNEKFVPVSGDTTYTSYWARSGDVLLEIVDSDGNVIRKTYVANDIQIKLPQTWVTEGENTTSNTWEYSTATEYMGDGDSRYVYRSQGEKAAGTFISVAKNVLAIEIRAE